MDQVHERLTFQMGEAEWQELKTTICIPGFRGAILGPKGYGKSTLCERLLMEARQEEWSGHTIRLSSSDNARSCKDAVEELLADLRPRDKLLVILDGAEQLRHREWSRFLRRVPQQAALLITSHEAGRLPTIFTCQTSPALLADLARQCWPEVWEVLDLNPAELWHQTDGNIRDALAELYHRCADLPDDGRG